MTAHETHQSDRVSVCSRDPYETDRDTDCSRDPPKTDSVSVCLTRVIVRQTETRCLLTRPTRADRDTMSAHETHQRQTETRSVSGESREQSWLSLSVSRDPPETDRDSDCSRDPPETDRDTVTAHETHQRQTETR